MNIIKHLFCSGGILSWGLPRMGLLSHLCVEGMLIYVPSCGLLTLCQSFHEKGLGIGLSYIIWFDSSCMHTGWVVHKMGGTEVL